MGGGWEESLVPIKNENETLKEDVMELVELIMVRREC